MKKTILKQSQHDFLVSTLVGIFGVLAMLHLAVVFPPPPTILLLGLVQFLAQGLEVIAGFGSSAIGIPIMTMISDLSTAKAVAVAHTWLLALYVIIVSGRDIAWRELGFITLYVAFGFPVGMVFFKHMNPTFMMVILALFMVIAGWHGFYTTRRNHNHVQASTEQVNRSHLMRFILFLGGIIHGAFGSGGPLIVIYVSQALKRKAIFRASLCMLWFGLNSLLLIQFTLDGVWMQNNCFTLYATIATLPFLVLGIIVGGYLYHRVSEYAFRLIVFALLFGTGLFVLGTTVQ